MTDFDAQRPAAEATCAASLEALREGLRLLDAVLAEQLAVVNGYLEHNARVPPGTVITPAEVEALAREARGRAPSSPVAGIWRQLSPRLEAARAAGRKTTTLERVQRRFDLDGFEMDCLLAVLAPELDRKYERIYAYLNDDLTLRYPSLGVLLHVLAADGEDPIVWRRRLVDGAPLFHYGLLEWVSDGRPHSAVGVLSRCVRASESLVRFMLEEPYAEAGLEAWSPSTPPPAGASQVWAQQRVERAMLRVLDAFYDEPPTRALIVELVGSHGSGRRHAVATACARKRVPQLPPVDCARVLQTPDLAPGLLRCLVRDAALWQSPLLLLGADVLAQPAAQPALLALENAVEDFATLVCLSCDEERSLIQSFRGQRRIRLHYFAPGASERVDQWRLLLQRATDFAEGERGALAEALGGTFRLNAGQASQALLDALCAHKLEPERPLAELLRRAAALQSSPRLGKLGQRVQTSQRLEQLVLPEGKLDLVRDVVRRVRHRRRVFDQWGFDRVLNRGRGLNALFSGPPGTGKTMAAEVIANELGVELYRIDLSCVVSKYIGETEKNLARVFEEAERADAILFFDEADALFGKRSEVHDAHDRYANVEVNYLLQAMESFEGVCILATNFRQNIDAAFFRRIHIAVDFPLPGVTERLRIWQQVLADTVPLAPDIDLAQVSRRYDISGGSIVNMALAAAFLAADDDTPLGMHHIAAAARREFDKLGRREVSGFANGATPYVATTMGAS